MSERRLNGQGRSLRAGRECPLRRRFFKSILVGIRFPHERRQLARKRAAQLAKRRGPGRLHFHNWQLIRLSPAPVLFVRQMAPCGRARVLAAVDPLHAKAKPADPDERILEMA